MKKKRHFSTRIIQGLTLLLNLLALLWLFLCKWASFHNPAGHPSLISLLSLTTIFAVFINLFFIFYWLFTTKKWRSLFSLVAIVLLWGMIRPLVGFNYFNTNNLAAADGDIKIMTWNIHLFNLGAWVHDETAKAKIIKLIKQENPDVLCLEEYYRTADAHGLPYTDIIRNLGYPYFAFSKQYTLLKRRMTIHADKRAYIEVGNAVFSKFPLEDTRTYNLGVPHYNMLRTDVAVDSNHKVSLDVVHLTSVRFGDKEMEYLKEIKKQGLEGQDATQSRHLLNKLTYAFSQRAVLANTIDSLKKFMDYPMIICGDFNDVPSSYVYNKVKGKLKDPFPEKGIGMGRTYRNIFPTLRIDYILYDGNAMKALGYGRKVVNLSDHFPVTVNLKFKSGK